MNNEVIKVAHLKLIRLVSLEKRRDKDTRDVWHRVKAIENTRMKPSASQEEESHQKPTLPAP